jgi:hypothetical protein
MMAVDGLGVRLLTSRLTALRCGGLDFGGTAASAVCGDYRNVQKLHKSMIKTAGYGRCLQI